MVDIGRHKHWRENWEGGESGEGVISGLERILYIYTHRIKIHVLLSPQILMH